MTAQTTPTAQTAQNTINVARYARMVEEHSALAGEAPYAAYYWEQYLNGDGEELWPADATDENGGFDDSWTIFEVNYDEAIAFDIPHGAIAAIWSDSQGFQYGRLFPDAHTVQAACNDYYGLESVEEQQ